MRLGAVLLACSLAGQAGAAEVVSFTLHRDYLVVVRGSIGPLDDLALIVDTGAPRTIVSRRVASLLGVTGQPTTLGALGPRCHAEEVALPNLRLGPIRVLYPLVLVTDTAPLARTLGLDRVDGIVGLDVLSGTDFAIDYESRHLEFGQLRPTERVVPLDPHALFLVINGAINGGPIDLAVDTGSAALVLFEGRTDLKPGPGAPLRVSAISGSAPAAPVPVEDLWLGPWRSEQSTGLVVNVGTTEWPGVSGLLGVRALRARYVRFDLTRHSMGWTP